jgi:hypothetical protein
MAISVGNLHLQQSQGGKLDEERLQAIEAVTDVPLVIHGGSGVPASQRLALALRLAAAARPRRGPSFRRSHAGWSPSCRAKSRAEWPIR